MGSSKGFKQVTGKSVPFTQNVRDRSNSSGYQFEFLCQRCGNGYRSALKPATLSITSKVTSGLTGILGKKFGGLAKTGGGVLQDLAQSSEKDKAFQEAAAEIGPMFHQCPKCGQWVCDRVCWNPAVGMCVTDAPKKQHQSAANVVACSNCGASVDRASKFCPECGQPLKTTLTCPKCGHESPRGTKFCAECGTKLE
jgi:RNA polymerase subunit RPABC4/transcription elongation factor Spt4